MYVNWHRNLSRYISTPIRVKQRVLLVLNNSLQCKYREVVNIQVSKHVVFNWHVYERRGIKIHGVPLFQIFIAQNH